MARVEFRYELIGRGWAQCDLAIDGHAVSLTASYLSDGLQSLVAATNRILIGMPEATASFAEEPGEYRWKLARMDDASIQIVVLKFEDWCPGSPDRDGQSVFTARCRLRTFAGAVYDGCKRLLSAHGVEQYRMIWHKHDFPMAELAELKELLDTGKARPTS